METSKKIKTISRRCFVPGCHNNNRDNPDLVLVKVRDEQKEEWCRMVNRYCVPSPLYCCENHLDLETDLENYMRWKISGSTPRLKANATLHIQEHLRSISDERIENGSDENKTSTPANIIVHSICKTKKKHKMPRTKPMKKDRSTYPKAVSKSSLKKR